MNARPETAPDPWRLAAGLLALVVLLQFTASSWLWPLMADSGFFESRADYRVVRRQSGFRGIPIEDVVAGLDRLLPHETPVRLGPRLAANGQWAQRISEGIYPRPVEADAKFVVELGSGTTLAQTPQGPLALQGKLPPPPPAPVIRTTDFQLSWARVALHALSAFGWGAALAFALARIRRKAEPIPLLASAALGAPVVLGVFATAATVMQRPLPWTALHVVGLGLAIVALALSIDRRRPVAQLRERLAWVRAPEVWILLALSALLLRHLSIWPIIGWDGRSIWLYRTKMLFYNGFLPAADAANLQNYFSHMEYPLLFPAWMAHFASGAPLRERECGVAIILLQMGLLSALWWLAQRRLGRWTGAAFAAAIYVVSVGMAERGYADGLVTIYLVCMLLGLDDEPLERFGWLAAVGAMLSKSEGLVFALMVAAGFVLLHPRFRARRWLPRFVPAAVVLLPSLAQAAWTKAVHVKSQYEGAHLPTLHEAAGRLQIIWTGVAKLARENDPVAHFPAALACFVVLEMVGRRTWPARIGALTGVGVAAFSLAVMLVTPYDVAWHVDTAVGRLLLHGVFALVTAVLVALTPPPAPAPAL